MTSDTIAAALEREHRQIDQGIEDFLAAQADGQGSIEPLRQAIDALRRHIFLEEEFVFPPLREAGMVAPIFVMLREHGEIWDTMDRLDAELEAGSSASSTPETCVELLAQLERHNAKEEPIIYPQTDAVLAPAAAAGLRAFLAAGQIPEGWVCARVGARTDNRQPARGSDPTAV